VRVEGVIVLVTESKNKSASVFARLFFRFDFEAVATADLYMRLSTDEWPWPFVAGR
jgi:hypothetical protein